MPSAIASTSQPSHRRKHSRQHRSFMASTMKSVAALATSLLLLPAALAQSNFRAINNATTLTGTWSSGSQAVTTGIVSFRLAIVSETDANKLHLCRASTIQSPRTSLYPPMPECRTLSQMTATLRRLLSPIPQMVSVKGPPLLFRCSLTSLFGFLQRLSTDALQRH